VSVIYKDKKPNSQTQLLIFLSLATSNKPIKELIVFKKLDALS